MKDVQDSGIWAYLRLSRDEEKERGVSMAEKILLRKQILQTIARHYDLPLPDEHITVELMSGGSLSERTGLLDILERCRRKEIHTLVCFDVDRLTRDVADLKTILSALYRGQITLITQRGVERLDKNHDATLLQILAVLGEKERRSFSYRRKAANTQRTRAGRPSNGAAPYGYRWHNAANAYTVEAAEYAAVTEIFQRGFSEGGQTIATDLNTRGLPPPSAAKHGSGKTVWSSMTVRDLLTNPFYCGYITHRDEADRDGRVVKLPRAEWVWAEAPGDWPCPVTREEWESLQEIMQERRYNRQSCGVSRGLLTGLLQCSGGRPMTRANTFYQCDCRTRGQAHAARHISRAVIEQAVLAAAARRLDTLPPLPPPPRTKPAPNAAGGLRTLRAKLREKENTLHDLTRRAGFYIGLPSIGTAGHARMLTDVDAEITDIAAQIRAQEASEATGAENVLRLHTLRIGALQGGELLREATDAEQREILRTLIQSVQLIAPPASDKRQLTRSIQVAWWPAGDAPGPEIVPLYSLT